MLTSAPVPDQHIGGAAAAVAGDHVATGLSLFQQIRLMPVSHHDEPEGLVRGFHAVHGLRHGAVGMVGPGGIGNGGDGRQGGGVQPAADGESLAGFLAIVEEIGLVAGGVRADRREAVAFW